MKDKPKVTFRSAAFIQQVTQRALRRARKAAEYLRKAIQENIAVQGPPSSGEGEFPHKRTGELQESIVVVPYGKTGYKVMATAEHAKFVERMRPFMARTLKEELPTVIAIMKGKGSIS